MPHHHHHHHHHAAHTASHGGGNSTQGQQSASNTSAGGGQQPSPAAPPAPQTAASSRPATTASAPQRARLTLSQQITELQQCVDSNQISKAEFTALRSKILTHFVADSEGQTTKQTRPWLFSLTSDSLNRPARDDPTEGVNAALRRDPTTALEPAAETSDDAAFWCGVVRQRAHFRPVKTVSGGRVDTGGQSRELKKLDQATVTDLLDVTEARLVELFRIADRDDDGVISTEELVKALKPQGFLLDVESANEIMRKLGVQPDTGIPLRKFDSLLKRLRIAELFTHDAGVFQFSTERCHTTSATAVIQLVDWVHGSCVETSYEGQEACKPFFFGNRGGSSFNRWVHLDSTQGVDYLTLLRLAVKYRLHPLAIDDILDIRTGTKLDLYGDNYVISAEIVALAKQPKPRGPMFLREPPKVRMHRSHVTIFLLGGQRNDTLLTVHQERPDDSNWLQSWTRPEEYSTEAEPMHDVFADLKADLQQEPPRRVREHACDFLTYEVLHRIVAQLRPIAEAYAERLGYMKYWSRRRRFNSNWLEELDATHFELKDIERSVRPMRQVVRHMCNDETLRGAARTYLEDVDDAIDSMLSDVSHLDSMANSLLEEYRRNGEKRTNDTLFALSVISFIFLPAQFATGWYGMNFVDMPELEWEWGYQYFWCLVGLLMSMSVLILMLYTIWTTRKCCCCRCQQPKKQKKPKRV